MHAHTLNSILKDYLAARWWLSAGYSYNLEHAVWQLSRFYGTTILLSCLTEDTLTAFLRDFSKTHEPIAVNDRRRSLLTLWRYAAEKNLLPPPKKIPIMPEGQKIPDAWTAAECRTILAECRKQSGTIAGIDAGAWWASFVLTIYYTGQRLRAMLSARTEDYESGTITFQPRGAKTRKAMQFELPREAAEIIDGMMHVQRVLLWPWPFHRNTIFVRFRKITERAGASAPHGKLKLFHRLRRTSGSLVESLGGDGARHLGNSREVFERSYLAPRICNRCQSSLLPNLK